MADPFSIIGGVHLAFTLASALKNYYDDAKGAKDDLKGLVKDIESTYLAVQELQHLLTQNRTSNPWNKFGVARAEKCVNDSSSVLQRLGSLLLKSGAELNSEELEKNINTGTIAKASLAFLQR